MPLQIPIIDKISKSGIYIGLFLKKGKSASKITNPKKWEKNDSDNEDFSFNFLAEIILRAYEKEATAENINPVIEKSIVENGFKIKKSPKNAKIIAIMPNFSNFSPKRKGDKIKTIAGEV